MRVVSGAISNSNKELVKMENKWYEISKRRTDHVLIMFYKILSGDASAGLINIFAELTINNEYYNLRNNQIRVPYCRTTQYKNSFFPFAINIWNSLPNYLKECNTLKQFKSKLKKIENIKKNLLFYFGERKIAIHHARIRMGCSLLNSHISILMHLTDNPSCSCGLVVESPKHFFIDCPLYAGPRLELSEKINELTDFNINIILFGDKNLTLEQNKSIFKSVHRYMNATRRFE